MQHEITVPIAIPISACVNAGASFMPSPTITTFFPWSCNFLISKAFDSGNTWDGDHHYAKFLSSGVSISDIVYAHNHDVLLFHVASDPAISCFAFSLNVSDTANKPTNLSSMKTSNYIFTF